MFLLVWLLVGVTSAQIPIMDDEQLIQALLKNIADDRIPDSDSSDSTEPSNFNIGDSMVNFTLDLMDLVEPGGNKIISPLSIVSLLNLLLLGADGETHRQLRKALHYPARIDDILVHTQCGIQLGAVRSSPGTTINIANKLFIADRMSLRISYLRNAKNFYNASAEKVSFAANEPEARRRINQWVSDETRGLIPKIIENPLRQSTTLVAGSAIYFNGIWAHPFHSELTASVEFQVSPSENIMVDAMFGAIRVPYLKARGFAVLALPYEGRDQAMYVFLPDQAGEQEVLNLERQLHPDRLRLIINSLTLTKTNVYLPRFKMMYHAELGGLLQRLGVNDLFDPVLADLSQLAGGENAFLSDVMHEAVIEVSERGTKAAAATVGVTNRGGFTPQFKALRPFLFLIRDNRTGVPLFWGRVIRPGSS